MSTDMGKTLFNLQRFMILQMAVNPATSDRIPLDYVFAWYHKIYPFFESGELHEDLTPYFEITKEQVDYLTKYLDDEWLNKRTYTFYELEDQFNSRHSPKHGLDRLTLMNILQYIKLRGGFDDAFWSKLLEPMQHPSEAQSILSDFSVDNIYFI